MTLEYRCSNCGTLLETTNADAVDSKIERLRAALEMSELARDRALAEVERLRERLGPLGLEVVEIDGAGHYVNVKVKAEIKRLTLENWQLKGALGYPVPGDIPQGPFKCGLCEARALEPKP